VDQTTLPEKKEEPHSGGKKLSLWISFAAVAAGLLLARLSYLGLIPLGSKLGPYPLNHWIGWLSLGFIAVFIPIFIILKKRSPRIFQRLMRMHEVSLLSAFILVSLHIGWQIKMVFPPELGTGIAAYVCLFVLVVTGIMQRNLIFVKCMTALRFVHLSMAVNFFLIIVFHVIRAFLI
jgi:hypothetical protein